MTSEAGPAQVILLVSADAPRRAALGRLLEGRLLGVRVAEAAHTGEAAEELRDRPVAVVLADHSPELDAVDVLAEARRLAPLARRVLVAGQVDLSLVGRALEEARIHGLLPRPVAPDLALQVLGRLLAQAREEAPQEPLPREDGAGRRDVRPSAATGDAAEPAATEPPRRNPPARGGRGGKSLK